MIYDFLFFIIIHFDFYIFSFYLYLRNAIKERVEKCFDAIKKIESCEGSLLNFANSYLNFGIRPKGDYLYIKGKILKMIEFYFF